MAEPGGLGMYQELLNDAVNCYFILAVGYNLLSIVINDMKGRMLTPTDPVFGILMLALLYLIYAAEPVLGGIARTALITVFLLLVLRFGIYRHLAGYDEEQYFSRGAWGVAIAINVYGVAALSLALVY